MLHYLFIGLIILLAGTVDAAEFDHSRWDALLTKYVEVHEKGKNNQD
jgi:hypothetical protein